MIARSRLATQWRRADAIGVLAVVIAALFGFVPDADGATSVSTTGIPLTEIPGLSAGIAHRINNAGEVAGSGMFVPNDGNNDFRAFFWSGVGAPEDIIPSPFGDGARTNINESGEVAGWFHSNTFLTRRAFRWAPGTTADDLGVPLGYVGGDIQATGIDDFGNVVGFYLVPVGTCAEGSSSCGFYGQPGQHGAEMLVVDEVFPTDVDLYSGSVGVVVGIRGTWTPPGTRATDVVPLEGDVAVGRGITELMIAGSVDTPDGTRATFWPGPDGGAPTILGTLGGSFSAAFGINAQGWVVGQSETATGEIHAFLWTPSEGMIDLGTLGGATSTVQDINDRGQIAGGAENANGITVAVVWERGAEVNAPSRYRSDPGTAGAGGVFAQRDPGGDRSGGRPVHAHLERSPARSHDHLDRHRVADL